MDTAALEQQLADAQIRYRNACDALAPKDKGGEWEEYNLADAALLKAERELAEAKGPEHAVPSDFPILWDGGAPSPLVITNAYKSFLIFRVRVCRFNPDGTRITVQDTANVDDDPMALVEFKRCVSVKLGAPIMK